MHDDRALTARAEQLEADARAAITLAVPPALAATLGILLLRDGGTLASLASALDVVALNRVVGLGVHAPASEAQLDRILAVARDCGVRRIVLHLAPTAQPPELVGWILARGGTPYDRWARLWRRTDAPPAAHEMRGLALVDVGPDRADDFARVVQRTFEMPPELVPWLAAVVGRPGWRHYAAADGDEIVATAALYIANGAGWLGYGTTLPSHRGRGAQSALIAHRIREAAALGCDWVASETAEELPDHPVPSYRNMRRLGFTDAYHRQNYLLTLAPDARRD